MHVVWSITLPHTGAGAPTPMERAMRGGSVTFSVTRPPSLADVRPVEHARARFHAGADDLAQLFDGGFDQPVVDLVAGATAPENAAHRQLPQMLGRVRRRDVHRRRQLTHRALAPLEDDAQQ